MGSSRLTRGFASLHLVISISVFSAPIMIIQSLDTSALIRWEYTWPSIRTFVTDYCRSCTTCSRNKAKRHKPYSLLRQLPIPSCLWNSISMDFIEHLPVSERFTAILVVVDCFTKQSIFIPTHNTITSTQLAELFVIHVFSKHSVLSHVTSDRGSKFISHFFRSLGKVLDMKLHFTLGYHPEGDGQTEHINQTLEQYIQIFTNYQQDNWSSLLPLAEFSYNNAPNATTGVSPFFANKGYDPAITIHPEYELASSWAHKFVTDLSELHEELQKAILLSQEQYQCSADKNRIPPPDFKVSDRVFVKAKCFCTTHPTKKFSEKYLSPYEIINQAGPLSWTLRLPDSMRVIHPVFHVSMLEPSTLNSSPDYIQPPPPPVLIDGKPEYEILEILDSKLDNRHCYDFPFPFLFTLLFAPHSTLFHLDCSPFPFPRHFSMRLSSFPLSMTHKPWGLLLLFLHCLALPYDSYWLPFTLRLHLPFISLPYD